MVLYDLRAHDRLPPASTPKIMTSLLAIEKLDPNQVITSDIDATTLTGSSVMGLRPGVAITVRDLLYGLMLPSGNDAAIELARAIDGTEQAFVRRMNQPVTDLGLTDTHFVNSHGLDSRRHYSSAYDLAMLARAAMKSAVFADLVGTRDRQLARPSITICITGTRATQELRRCRRRQDRLDRRCRLDVRGVGHA